MKITDDYLETLISKAFKDTGTHNYEIRMTKKAYNSLSEPFYSDRHGRLVDLKIDTFVCSFDHFKIIVDDSITGPVEVFKL